MLVLVQERSQFIGGQLKSTRESVIVAGVSGFGFEACARLILRGEVIAYGLGHADLDDRKLAGDVFPFVVSPRVKVVEREPVGTDVHTRPLGNEPDNEKYDTDGSEGGTRVSQDSPRTENRQ